MAKKHILHLEFQHAFKAIGIFSAQKDYRLCWMLNKQLGIDLKRMPDFCLSGDADNAPVCYPVYRYEQPNIFLDVLLLANRNEQGVLLQTPKNLDYILLYKSPENLFNLSESLAEIRKIPQVLAAFLLKELPAKKESEFFFDLEMYLSQL
jgi:hypothetical protein